MIPHTFISKLELIELKVGTSPIFKLISRFGVNLEFEMVFISIENQEGLSLLPFK